MGCDNCDHDCEREPTAEEMRDRFAAQMTANPIHAVGYEDADEEIGPYWVATFEDGAEVSFRTMAECLQERARTESAHAAEARHVSAQVRAECQEVLRRERSDMALEVSVLRAKLRGCEARLLALAAHTAALAGSS